MDHWELISAYSIRPGFRADPPFFLFLTDTSSLYAIIGMSFSRGVWKSLAGARAPRAGALDLAARDELFEEMGGVVAHIKDLGVIHTSTGLTQESFQVFFAELSEVGTPNTSEGISEIVSLRVSELEELISLGEITDSILIAAYARSTLQGRI